MARRGGGAPDFLTSPFFKRFTDPRFMGLLSPQGETVANEISMLSGAGAPAAIYNFNPRTGEGRLPHVQTSPGVYESAFRVAGLADPRFDDPARVEASTRQNGLMSNKVLAQLLQPIQ